MNLHICIGIGFIFLSLAILAGVIGIFKYQLSMTKEKVDIKPSASNINQSKKND